MAPSARIEQLETQMAVELARTLGAKLTEMPSIGTMTAAGMVAFIGPVDRWDRWAAVWRGQARPGPGPSPATPTRP